MPDPKSMLAGAGPVCCEMNNGASHVRLPAPVLFSNIPLTRKMLQMVVEDWGREASTIQLHLDNLSNENEKTIYVAQAFFSLQPLFLKCLFSYAMFFVVLERIYGKFYQELTLLNKEPFFQVKHLKRPIADSYIEKVRRIRNYSIAHIDSPRTDGATAAAASMWQPMTISKEPDRPWNIDKLTFGSLRITQYDDAGQIKGRSEDLEIAGIRVSYGEKPPRL
jgi:hypothetical protein